MAGDQVRSLIVPTNTGGRAQPLVLSRRDFEKIRKAARIISQEEKARIQAEHEEARETALKVKNNLNKQLQKLSNEKGNF